MAQDYRPIVTDSNDTPIGIELKRQGRLADLSDHDVTVTVRDPSTRQTIVASGVATVVGPGRADFYFTAAQVALIVKDSIWLCEWCFAERGGMARVLRLAPIRLPVAAKLLVA